MNLISWIEYTAGRVPFDISLGRLLVEKFVHTSRKLGTEQEELDYNSKLPSSREVVKALSGAFMEYRCDPTKSDPEVGEAVKESYMVNL